MNFVYDEPSRPTIDKHCYILRIRSGHSSHPCLLPATCRQSCAKGVSMTCGYRQPFGEAADSRDLMLGLHLPITLISVSESGAMMRASNNRPC
ncbi:hypothetical protein T440DRAFT_51814 [Plenodomus tracheiphilus IPT5]|uniref:Uncharacterized protein n=1 Tax=Plenodomus tracheiphilus IPT5 TaxID=1408161 RepID=A0A6A7B978_9PLEO|nr:hypothetical protein T440DRAFT_51814 [Plenodomus tracheiphilus IPT5]